jgi:hypothetical protein
MGIDIGFGAKSDNRRERGGSINFDFNSPDAEALVFVTNVKIPAPAKLRQNKDGKTL